MCFSHRAASRSLARCPLGSRVTKTNEELHAIVLNVKREILKYFVLGLKPRSSNLSLQHRHVCPFAAFLWLSTLQQLRSIVNLRESGIAQKTTPWEWLGGYLGLD